jgi:hypothetical protein
LTGGKVDSAEVLSDGVCAEDEEHDEQRLIVGGLVYLKAVERDHKIKSAQDASVRRPKEKASA